MSNSRRARGKRGVKGSRGSRGARGPRGPRGVKGFKGNEGESYSRAEQRSFRAEMRAEIDALKKESDIQLKRIAQLQAQVDQLAARKDR